MQRDQAGSRSARSGIRLRQAYPVWAVALAVGVLLHEFQEGDEPWSFRTLVPPLLAIAVLLKPSSVPRMLAMLGALAIELVLHLPNPVNHVMIMGTVGVATVTWWVMLAARSRTEALDPGIVFERIAPFLRFAFILAFYAAAIAKLNEGFLDTAMTCAAWVLNRIPLVTVPSGLRELLIVATLVVEFAIPTLLLFRRTRALAILLGLGFHAVSALAGYTAFSAYAWSFYVLFLPSGVLVAVAIVVARTIGPGNRQRLADAASSPLIWLGLVAVWVLATTTKYLLSDVLPLHRATALPYLVWITSWVCILVSLRARWNGGPVERDRGALRVRHPVFLLALLLLAVNAASPYIGLKSRASFTMFSNLRTEPGLWNHLILPESVRVFDWQQGVVRLGETGDPELRAKIDDHGGDQLVLLDARLLVADHPEAIVGYELDGVSRIAAPVGSDPVLSALVSPVVEALGAFRPIVTDNRCQH